MSLRGFVSTVESSPELFAQNALAHESALDILKMLHMMAPELADARCERSHFTMDELVMNNDEFLNTLDGLEYALHQTILLHDPRAHCTSWITDRQS